MFTRRQFAAIACAATPARPQDVGNHDPLMQSLAAPKPSHSWLEPRFENLHAWKREAQSKFIELLHYSPANVEPAPKTFASVDRGAFVIDHIEFSTTPALRVPAMVLRPKKSGRLPAIVALHDHGGYYMWGREKLATGLQPDHPDLVEFRKRYYAGRKVAEDLASAGYLVIVIDMHYWGERRMLLADDAEDWRTRSGLTRERIAEFNRRSSANEELMGRTILSAGATWAGIMTVDDVRTVDYLVTREDVDPHRIGCVGLSVGGLRSCYLAAADSRIKAAVAIGWMTSFPSQLRSKVNNTIGHTKLIPGLYRYLDYPDIATLAMPSALLAINGGKDGLFNPEGVRLAFDKLRSAYKKAGIGEKVQCTLYPESPHEFNLDMQAEAWKFLARWI